MKLRIGAIAVILVSLMLLVATSGWIWLVLTVAGVLGLIRSFRPGGHWHTPRHVRD